MRVYPYKNTMKNAKGTKEKEFQPASKTYGVALAGQIKMDQARRLRMEKIIKGRDFFEHIPDMYLEIIHEVCAHHDVATMDIFPPAEGAESASVARDAVFYELRDRDSPPTWALIATWMKVKSRTTVTVGAGRHAKLHGLPEV